MHLEIWQWAVVIFAAYGIGLAKTGITGVGIIAVSLFAYALGGPASMGVVLPLLILTDCIAVLYYRRHAVWSHLWRLFPWAGLGVVLGWITMRWLHDDSQISHLMGGLLLGLILLQLVQRVNVARRKAQNPEQEDQTPSVGLLASGGVITLSLGLLAGFSTMVANASGPLMVLYLLAARLPKMEFVGTGAWYYFCLNLFKVPFSWQLNMLNLTALRMALTLSPVAIAGAFSGRKILPHINQHLFENLSLILTALAAVKLLLTAHKP
ncbi:MAG TPA: sulfite exporter TauE/SafE family protein [Chthonomonadaceae bacterium]|nr:sulfite exporter TauE/SafE family protein [Chthonomonadaceae bacterium]